LNFIRRLISLGAVVLLATMASGCVVRPLWWGDHDHHERERSGARSEHQSRDYGRHEDWRQGR
jgi:hypothetical protein